MTPDVLSSRSHRAYERRDATHFVYELWGNRACLYVGVTSDLGKRLATHGRKDWWPDVRRVVANAHSGRAAGLVAEKDLIEEHDPIHNRQGVL